MVGHLYQSRPKVWATQPIRVVPSLPAMSWLAVVDKRGVAVVCGPGVEHRDEGVFEGCWDGEFEAFDFHEAATVAGSGIRFTRAGLHFVSPSHTLEGLYVLETPRRLVVSNSIAFLLRHERLDVPTSARVCRQLATVVLGMDRYEPVVFATDDHRLSRVVNATIDLGRAGVTVRQRSGDRAFDTFAKYRGHVLETIRRVAVNGASPSRGRRFGLVTTVSSGYDSAACAALARACGCRTAVTLSEGRSGRGDSGRPVAEALGLDVHEAERSAMAGLDDAATAAEFIATGMGGEDLPLAAFESVVPGNVLLTGFHGDKVWDGAIPPNDALIRGDVSGSSLTEFRLRTGFVHLPVPFIGALGHADITRITHAEEMRPFSVGGSYDRPIPRRIAEEAGVPRELFGQRKEMVSVLGFVRLGVLPRAARNEIAAYARAHASSWLRMASLVWFARLNTWRGIRVLGRRFGLAHLPKRLECAVIGDDYKVFEHASPISGELAFRWAIERVGTRYALDRED